MFTKHVTHQTRSGQERAVLRSKVPSPPFPQQPPRESEHFTVKDAAARIGVNKSTMWRWRQRGIGPEWVVIGGCTRYPREAVKRYIQSGERND
ncbi:helix-turn-helix transcriptional regulator [Nannocystis pusilla]|uniref:helix-turn-helix transcriptional regulator n=1 Tax=Nannocystis pusilla TaxID=889268 RepID=UPI003B762D67